MSQFAMGGFADGAAKQHIIDPGMLEGKLQGLSENELSKLQELITGRLSRQSSKKAKPVKGSTEATNAQRLTARESEVLTLIASGYTRPEVAAALQISRNTAATHVANIYRKLEVESIAEATMLAFRWGIVS